MSEMTPTGARQALERCEVCGWPLKETAYEGCIKGNCSQRPAPQGISQSDAYSALVAERDQLAEKVTDLRGMALNQAHRADQLAEKVKTLRDAVSAFVEGMEICHMCGSLLAVEDAGPSHCEDCSGDCDDHEGPDCAIMHDLYSAMKRAALASTKPEEPA